MPDLTPEIQAELRRLLDAPPQDITIARDDALALLDAAAERDALAAKVERVRALGDHWVRLSGTSMTDEVREWTLAAGLSIRAALDGAES